MMKLYGKNWPDDFPYRFFIGMHTTDYDQTPHIPHLLRDMNGREIIRQLADVGVDAVYFYMSCHSGSCFYPTEIKPGHMHSGLKGRDVFGEAADEAQKLGVALIAVYEFENRRIVDSGPREWSHYYPDKTGNKWFKWRASLCWNTGYGDFVKAQMTEVARRYPIAGFYVDMLDYPGLVCCAECARRFKEDVGVAPPRKYDEDSALFKVFRLWGYREEARFLDELRGCMQEHQPGVTVINNYHCLRCEDLYETADANDYLATDPGLGFMRTTTRMNALPSIYAAISRGKPRYDMLADPRANVISILPAESYNAATSMVPAQGGASAFPSDMLDQHGKLRDLEITRIASAFTKARYPWRAEGERVRFAGLYLSQESELFHAGDFLYSKRDAYMNKYIDEFCGAYLMLQEEHLPTDVLTRRDLERLHEYPVIYLANVACMSEPEANAFREYVRNGGTLVSSYRTSLNNEWNEEYPDFLLKDILGATYSGKKLETAFSQGLQMPLPAGAYPTEPWETRDVTLPQAALICAPSPDARVLLELFDRYRDKPGGPMRNAYRMETPAGPAVIENRFGKGKSIYFSGKIFSGYLHTGIPTLKKIAARWLIADVVDAKLLCKLQAPNSVEMTAFAQPDRNRILLHLVNFQATSGRQLLMAGYARICEQVLPVHDLELATQFKTGDIVKALLQPAGQVLDVADDNGLARIAIPKVHLHEIVEIVLRPGVCPEYPDSNKRFDYLRYDLREKARQYVASNPPGYDPDDDGAISFDDWPEDAEASADKEEWDGLGAMQGGNN